MAKISYATIFSLILIIYVSTASVEGALCSNDLYLNPCRESFCKFICLSRYEGGRGHCAKRKSHEIPYEVCACVHEHDCPH
ncbi:hypothetical protein HN51_024678 [Arachis hypogaea]|nr:uncharacterized protein DS421_7g210510 [Arachis hypogaea]